MPAGLSATGASVEGSTRTGRRSIDGGVEAGRDLLAGLVLPVLRHLRE